MTESEFQKWMEGFLAGATQPITQEQQDMIKAKLKEVSDKVKISSPTWTSTNTTENLDKSPTDGRQLLRD